MTAEKKTILIVEDDQGIRETLVEILDSEGYIVLSASNGLEALQVLRSTAVKPDLILLDLMMPVMDGLSFKAQSSQDPSLAKIPVVIMSADQKIIEINE